MKKLKEPKISYDKEVKMWVIVDRDCHVATQGRTKTEMRECYVDALRCMCSVLYDDITKKPKPTRRVNCNDGITRWTGETQ